MIVYKGLITHDNVVLDVEIDIDPDKLREHLLTVYKPAFSKAAKKGRSKSAKFGRSLVMIARKVNVVEEKILHSPDQTIHIITKEALEINPLR